jgi:hypothetical protein
VSPAIAAAVVIARLAAADAEELVGQAEQRAAEQQHTGQVEAGVQGVGGRLGRGAPLMPSVSWGRPGTADLPLRDLTRWPDASPRSCSSPAIPKFAQLTAPLHCWRADPVGREPIGSRLRRTREAKQLHKLARVKRS